MRSWKRNSVNWEGIEEKWEAGFQGQARTSYSWTKTVRLALWNGMGRYTS